MKVTLIMVFLLSVLEGIAQFDPSKEWFVLEDFFEQQQIEGNRIKGIIIYKSDKKDDEAFGNQRKIAQYFFTAEGRLSLSQKFVPLSGRMDTSFFEFDYKGNKLFSRTESQGPFCFKYSYLWLNDTVFQEVKTDQNTLDTNYIHRVEIQKEERYRRKFTYYNSIERPMKSKWVTNNSFGKVILQRESYSRSLSFVENSFNYKATQLVSRSKWNTIGRQRNFFWQFTYKEGYLDFIEQSEDELLVLKFAILYNDQRLIKSIVKRDVREKVISIYKIEYNYYSIER